MSPTAEAAPDAGPKPEESEMPAGSSEGASPAQPTQPEAETEHRSPEQWLDEARYQARKLETQLSPDPQGKSWSVEAVMNPDWKGYEVKIMEKGSQPTRYMTFGEIQRLPGPSSTYKEMVRALDIASEEYQRRGPDGKRDESKQFERAVAAKDEHNNVTGRFTKGIKRFFGREVDKGSAPIPTIVAKPDTQPSPIKSEQSQESTLEPPVLPENPPEAEQSGVVEQALEQKAEQAQVKSQGWLRRLTARMFQRPEAAPVTEAPVAPELAAAKVERGQGIVARLRERLRTSILHGAVRRATAFEKTAHSLLVLGGVDLQSQASQREFARLTASQQQERLKVDFDRLGAELQQTSALQREIKGAGWVANYQRVRLQRRLESLALERHQTWQSGESSKIRQQHLEQERNELEAEIAKAKAAAPQPGPSQAEPAL